MTSFFRCRPARLVIAAGVSAAVAAGVAAPNASAAADYFDCTVSPHTLASGSCYGDRHSLTASYARSYGGTFDVYVGAATSFNPTNLYGSLVYGSGYRCHSYSGQTVLHPIVVNIYTYRRPYQLFSQWGSGGLTCDQLSPVRFAARSGRSVGERSGPASASENVTTKTGIGAVSQSGDRVCLAVPDPVDGYGVGCASAADVKRRGLTVGLAGEAAGTITSILPDGGSASVQRKAAQTPVTQSPNGIVSVNVSAGDSLTIDGPAGSRTITAPSTGRFGTAALPAKASPFPALTTQP